MQPTQVDISVHVTMLYFSKVSLVLSVHVLVSMTDANQTTIQSEVTTWSDTIDTYTWSDTIDTIPNRI